MACAKIGTAASALLEYDTIKTVHIRSKKVGLIFRLLQLGILGYIVGYVIVYNKGYQEFDQAVSAIVTKVKGSSGTCRNKTQSLATCSNSSVRVWDTVDYTIPAQENNAFFVVTNFVETPGQQQREEGWDEDPLAAPTGTNKVWQCTEDSNCTRFGLSRNGILTGTCNTSLGLCRIFGWGPIELNAADDASQVLGASNQIPGVVNFTVFIKNNIFFPKFNTKFTNTGLGNSSQAYLTSCTWNPSTDPFCPVFRLGDIIQAAGINTFASKEVMTGAVITVGIRYTCDLDKSSVCAPEFTFTRTDDPNDKLSAGYNFRYGYYTTVAPGDVQRDLYKFFGLRFIFVVSGTAGRFSIIPLLVAFGSGLGLLGLATVIADLLVTKVLSNHELYSRHKYEYVDDNDENEMDLKEVAVRKQQPLEKDGIDEKSPLMTDHS